MITQAKTHLRRLLPKNAFARGVSVLVGGTAGAQLLTILAAPLLTRLYGPEDFGLVAVYGSLLALIGVISSLRYELAIPLPEDDGEAANVAALSLILVGIMTLLTGVLVLLLQQPIAEVLGVPQLAPYLWLLPVGVLLGGAYNVFNYWSVRTKRFSTIAETKIRQSLTSIAIQFAAFKLGGLGLLLAQVAGQSVGTTRLARPALASAGFKQVSWQGIVTAAGRYRRFPAFTTWSGLVNTAGQQLPPVMFAAFFTVAAAGLYALTHRILMLPATFLGQAIGTVFFSHAADAKRDGTIGIMYRHLQDKLVQIGLPPAAIIMVSGPFLFSIVFGDEWRVAGEFAQWLAVGIFAGFVASPLSQVFTVTEKQEVGLILQIILFLLRLAGIAIGAWTSSIEITVALFSLASLFGYTLYLYMMPKYVGVALSELFRSLQKATLFSALVILPLLISYIVDSNMSIYFGLLLTLLAMLARYWVVAKPVI
ncbi:oligosaccharide flippase family protein [Thiohalocapsa marina]|uniref:Oligosaccharide flippase family protein n=1 Tax=Thiohalocapsa marina TaxID=424902 RepID=A0A5M8FM87_9GAMM|nr:oligosaccharide flippase family protein [Thiohalocapsa marina]KAA6184826.1 oligosaccharide flippase family protein [Thiohalocapsa marina]